MLICEWRGRFQNVNMFLNCEPASLESKTIYSLVHPADRARFSSNLLPIQSTDTQQVRATHASAWSLILNLCIPISSNKHFQNNMRSTKLRATVSTLGISTLIDDIYLLLMLLEILMLHIFVCHNRSRPRDFAICLVYRVQDVTDHIVYSFWWWLQLLNPQKTRSFFCRFNTNGPEDDPLTAADSEQTHSVIALPNSHQSTCRLHW